MKPCEVNPNLWKKFFAGITASHRNTPVTIQSIGPDGRPRSIGENTPLRSLNLEQEPGTCSDILVLETGLPGEKPAQHRVTEPIYVRLTDGAGDRYGQIQITAEDGITVIILHPLVDPKLLQELDVCEAEK